MKCTYISQNSCHHFILYYKSIHCRVKCMFRVPLLVKYWSDLKLSSLLNKVAYLLWNCCLLLLTYLTPTSSKELDNNENHAPSISIPNFTLHMHVWANTHNVLSQFSETCIFHDTVHTILHMISLCMIWLHNLKNHHPLLIYLLKASME